MDSKKVIVRVPLSDLRQAILAMSVVKESMEDMGHQEEAQEIDKVVERLKLYHNAAIQQYGGDQEQIIR